jgi:hypothetical protein
LAGASSLTIKDEEEFMARKKDKDKTNEEFQEELQVLITKIDALRDSVARFDRLVARKGKIEEILRGRVVSNILSEPLTVKKIMSVNYLAEGRHIYMKDSRRLSLWCLNNYTKRGVFLSNINPINGQRMPQIAMDQNQPFEDQLGILDFIPFIEKCYSDRWRMPEGKVIDIFEHTCSEYMCIYLVIVATNDVQLWDTRHRSRCLERFKSYRAALKFIYQQHPYIVKEYY